MENKKNIIRQLINKINLFEKHYRDDIESLRQKRILFYKQIESECPHSISFHSDPAGGNDSYFSCSICGKESKKHFGDKND